MKKIYLLLLILASLSHYAQTITFDGCSNLFGTANYVFTKKDNPDTFNKGIYTTDPIDGDQPCGALGTCEFMIRWNNALTRWEFLADEGDGTFTSPYLIYYNSTGDNNAGNPPSNQVGTWVENTDVTSNACGGNLTVTNSSMTGDVQTQVLSNNDIKKDKMLLFPNPAIDYLTILGISNAKEYTIYSSNGQLVRSAKFESKIDVKSLPSGVYQLSVSTADSKLLQFRFIKK